MHREKPKAQYLTQLRKSGSAKKDLTSIEIKQSFLSSAIEDIGSYIHLVDTKVSIIMAAVVALLVGFLSCYETIEKLITNVIPCSWMGVLLIIFLFLWCLGIIFVFVFGILTVRGHVCKLSYKSKWFLSNTSSEYSFDNYCKDIEKMSANDIIENISAELYKLNNINQQKMKSFRWTLLSFSLILVSTASIALLFFINSI